MPAKSNLPLASPKPKPVPSERRRIPAQVPTYVELLLQDHNLTTDLYKVWPKLEQLLLAIQRGMVKIKAKEAPAEAGHVCVAADEFINVLQLFAEQGKLDMEHFFSDRV